MQLLSHQDTAKLLGLLLGCEAKPLSEFQHEFAGAFAPSDRFAAGCAAVLLLEDATLLRLPQRLAAWLLLSCCQQNATFFGLLIKAAVTPSVSAVERNLILQLLEGQLPAEVLCNSFKHYAITCNFEKLASAPEPGALQQLLLTRLHAQQQQAGSGPATSSAASQLDGSRAAAACGIAGPAAPAAPGQPASPFQTQPPAASIGPGAGPCSSSGSAGGAAGTSRPRPPGLPGLPLQPSWERPAPAVLTPLHSELKWVTPDLHGQLLWDSSLGEDDAEGRVAAVHELLAKALKAPLLPAQQQAVLSELEADPRLVLRLGLMPKHLPALVENAPVIATEVLLRLITTQRGAAFLQALASSEMSLRSMEVVNRLAGTSSLPTDFVHLYVANCIASCEGAADKYAQNRLVRLVCVFLQSLIRNKVVNIHDLLHEVQAFCINFSRIREAAKLFRLLKQIEAGGRGADPAALGLGLGAGDDDGAAGAAEAAAAVGQ